MDAREREAFAAYAQLPAFGRKVDQALAVIREALELGPAYVAVSWGKDSVVMLHLCQQVQPDILAYHLAVWHRHFFGDYDRVIAEYKSRNSLNYYEIMLSEDNLIFGGSTAQYLHRATGGMNVFLGLRKEESNQRRIVLSKYGETHQYSRKKTYRFCPLSSWETKDVWAYTAINNLPHLSFYDLVGKESRLSRTTALEGLRVRDKYWEADSRAWLRVHNPEFERWEPHGQIHVFVLLCLQKIKQKKIVFLDDDQGVNYCLGVLETSNANATETALFRQLLETRRTIDPFAVKLLNKIYGETNVSSNMD